MLDGEHGPAVALAMRVVVRTAASMQAEHLLDITGAHIDSCLYHGQVGLDFARRLADDGARVSVPTTLNVSSLDLLHPELYRGDDHTRTQARALMAAYEEMGCEPTWTCAPYQLDARPELGENVAWAESNAIVFANAVLGARTHRYGDFLDIAAAITGRAPAAGLHLDAARHATIEFDVSAVPHSLLDLDVAYPVLGHHIGKLVGSAVPVITGAPAGLSEDRLKAIGSAGASSGSLAMFHAVGSTPEAPDLATATGGAGPLERHAVTVNDLRVARDQLTTSTDPRLGAISLGTPHYSVAEFARVVELLGDRHIHPDVHAYINTGRSVANEISLRGWADRLADAGVQIVTDTCTYITPVMADIHGTAMTDSAKWAYYAPGNLGLDVAFGSVEDCIESAVQGRVVRDESVWSDA
jgi:predicted aconitase